MPVKFKELKLPADTKGQLFNIYYVVENSKSKRSIVMDSFQDLPEAMRDNIKALIIKMATNQNYHSPAIKYTLKGYSFGEIRPMPHRFFFFKMCGNNIIFFDYELKKTESLDDDIYKRVEKKKVKYEKEFEIFYEKNKKQN